MAARHCSPRNSSGSTARCLGGHLREVTMSTATIARPEADESSAYYHRYIARVSDEALSQQLMDQAREVERRFETVTDRQALARYAEGKWSTKELLGHLCDTER